LDTERFSAARSETGDAAVDWEMLMGENGPQVEPPREGGIGSGAAGDAQWRRQLDCRGKYLT